MDPATRVIRLLLMAAICLPWQLGWAAEAKGAAPPDVKELLGELRSEELAVRSRARRALEKIGKPVVKDVIPLLRDESKGARRAAAGVLRGIGRDACEAVPALIEALEDKDRSVRSIAAAALGKMGSHAKGAVPRLIELLNDRGDRYLGVRLSAASALGDIGPGAFAAVPALLAALAEKPSAPLGIHNVFRASIAEALGKIGPAAKKAIPALIKLLPEKDQVLRARVIMALGRLGREAAVAVPDIVKHAGPPGRIEKVPGKAAILALSGMGPPGLLELIELAVAAEDPDVRGKALFFLGQTLPMEEAVPDLIELLSDPRAEARVIAAHLLASFAEEFSIQTAVPALKKALKDDCDAVRKAAAAALKR